MTTKVRQKLYHNKWTKEQKEAYKEQTVSLPEKKETEEDKNEKMRALEDELRQLKLENTLLSEENQDMEDIIKKMQDEADKNTKRKKVAQVTEVPAKPDRLYPGQRKQTRPRGEWLKSTRNARLLRTKDLNKSIQQFAGKILY